MFWTFGVHFAFLFVGFTYIHTYRQTYIHTYIKGKGKVKDREGITEC